MGTHTGTHIDAPWHTVVGGASIDEIDFAQFHGQAKIVRVANAQAQREIGVGEVERQLDEVTGGDIVLFETGWSRHFNTPRYLQHPYLAATIAERLLDGGVTSVGLDALSPDHSPLHHAGGPVRLPFHQVFLGAGGVIFENLANLGAISGSTVLFTAFPLRLRGLDGSPVRAVALPGAS